jgi:putative transposase
MDMNRRKFSKEDKLAILKEATSKGVSITLEKHGIYPATYYSWKKKFETMGEEGFRHGVTPAQIKEIKRLEKENGLLKKLLAEKELEGHLKDEVLKKKYALMRKGR